MKADSLQTRGVFAVDCEITDVAITVGILFFEEIGIKALINTKTGDRYSVFIPDIPSPVYKFNLERIQ